MVISKFSLLFLLCAPIVTLFVANSVAQKNYVVLHVSALNPVRSHSQVFSAERPSPYTGYALPGGALGRKANPWKLQAKLSDAVIHDISFATAKIGYAVAEGGQVWKTTNGGSLWTEVLNLNYPYYFYGVHAFNARDVIISGFYDTSSSFEGLIRWSHDGGKTWTGDIVLSTTGWVQRVRFANPNDGLVMDLVDGSSNSAYYTTDGGGGAGDWATVVSNPDGGWFGPEFSLLPDLHARASGINYCTSSNGGAAWSCGPSIDSVFDGPVFFVNDKSGWVGGGEISPNVEGWLHRTTDGGKTWSGRTLDDPWPIREILFLSPKTGWAAGGNIYSNVGGIYFSRDGGKTWSVDVNTGAEMDACDSKRVGEKFQVWCAGYNSSLTGVIYTVTLSAE